MKRFAILLYVSAVCACSASRVAAQGSTHSTPADVAVAATPSTDTPAVTDEATPAARSSSASGAQPLSAKNSAIESDLRLEGEKRFRTNCGRCHMPPHKFAPRVMATAIRHMRVRATLTDEDMRLILHYMTQ